MDGRLDAGNLACAELVWASSILEIVLGGKQDCLCDDLSWSLTYCNRPDAWTLVEGYQAACQQSGNALEIDEGGAQSLGYSSQGVA